MQIPIYLRAYIKRLTCGEKDSHGQKNTNSSSSIVLVFDTETTDDKYQNLLFGSCGVWINGKSYRFYLFYADDLPENLVKIIKSFGSRHGFEVLSRRSFVDSVFFPFVYTARAKCVGFNLPFDLSRLAIHFATARKTKNAFSLKLSKNFRYPNIKIKSLNSKASFIQFTTPIRKQSQKKRVPYRGYFVDLRTLTFALTDNSYSLSTALDDFECKVQKMDTEKHGIVDEKYLEYNVNDTKVTYELYQKAMDRYGKYLLKKEVNRLYSPASIGKAYLEKIGISAFLEQNPSFSKKILGYLMSTYYGGRTEVRIRKLPVKASYIDFTSMYPSVFVLLGLYEFLIAEKITYRHSLNETQEFLNKITINDINKKETWRRFTTLCKIKPENDIVPVRTNYGGKNTTNIGINYLRSTDDTCLWYTLPDLIASKLFTGKTPKIVDAITFYPKGIQPSIKNIQILKAIPLNKGENFIQKLIEERIRIKQKIKKSSNPSKEEQNQAKLNQLILKIIANATSYGIFIQIDSISEDTKQEVLVYGIDSFKTQVDRTEKEGKYFNPVMSVFITAASRLILAAAEVLVEKNDGYLAYCDTDSIFVSPNHVKLVQEFFRSLNPYSENVEMFKVEDDAKGNELHDIWLYGISAKRYVLFDYMQSPEKITILKHSAHGLGHLLDIDQEKWWKDILKINYYPESFEKILSEYSKKYAISQITVSSPEILSRFKNFNNKKLYKNKIKPFNFATVGTGYQIDNNTKQPIIPLLPFADEKKRTQVPYMPFVDYKTGKLYTNENTLDTSFYWKPLSQVFNDYTNHTEAKSKGNLGVLKRFHLKINKSSIRYIGKETNQLDEANIIGVSSNNYTEYSKINEIILEIPPNKSYKIGISRTNLINLQNKIRKNTPIKLKKKTWNIITHYARSISLGNCAL